MAPNLITLISAASIQLSALLFLLYDPTLSSEFPKWYFGLSAFGVFVYQTLDALDGKQARRIKASSPLGQLFDHGCDAVSAISFNVLSIVSIGLGSSPVLALAAGTVNMVLCYFANLTEYHTGVMLTQIDNFGVSEVQWIQIFGLLLNWVLPFNPGTTTVGQYLGMLGIEWESSIQLNQILLLAGFYAL